MAENSNPFQDNFSPPPSTSEEKKSDKHFENIVNELRSVLSDLNHSPQEKTDLGHASIPSFEEPPSASPSEPEPSFLSDRKKENGHAPSPLADTPDNDFWNGNVLGWPTNADTELNDVPVTAEDAGIMHSVEPAPALEKGEATTDQDAIFSDLGPSQLDKPIMEEKNGVNMDAGFSPISMENETALGEKRENQKKEGDSSLERNPLDVNFLAPWETEVPPDLQNIMPPVPESPMAAAAKSSAPAAAFESQPSKMSEFQVPIPETLDRRPSRQETIEPDELGLEQENIKPKDVIQIACIFPEGQEKQGQTFVSKLKEVGEKAKIPLTIQAVFVHPWSANAVDIVAWKKSAILSGSDIMFVISTKAAMEPFRGAGLQAGDRLHSRLVLVEHISMPTLYADILVELQRGRK